MKNLQSPYKQLKKHFLNSIYSNLCNTEPLLFPKLPKSVVLCAEK